MQKVTLQEYSFVTCGIGTRILLYPNPTVGTDVLTLYINRGAKKLYIHKCVESLPEGGISRLPLPHELFAELRTRISSINEQTVVIGLDAYLSLLDSDNVKAASVMLYRLIDEDNLNAIFLLSSTWTTLLSTNFNNPKYENAMQLVSLEGELSDWHIPQITLIPDKWLETGVRGYAGLLSSLAEFEPVSGNLVVGISEYSRLQAGLNEAVAQITNIQKYMCTFHNIVESLLEPVLEFIFTKIREYKLSAIEAIQRDFGIENGSLRFAPKHLADCSDTTKWEAYVWMLQKTTNNKTYLRQVLDRANLSQDNFRRAYVVTSAVECLKHSNSSQFTEERYNALREMADDVTALISEFVDVTKEMQDSAVVPWLNNGTEVEHSELIRRIAKTDLTGGVPKNFAQVYLLLRDYLSDDFDYGDADINRYFIAYRRLKAQNTVTEEFAKTAYDMIVPSNMLSRNSLLQEFTADTDTSLLVVDGMGAEYLPLLLALAKRRGITVQSYSIAKAELPSSTEYNPIIWDNARKLTGEKGEKEIKSVDNIAHFGVSKGEGAPFERNFAATLDVFAGEVFKRISKGLANYARVVVTSDHGSSRLAILAHNRGFSKKLDAYGEVLDWRYAKAVPGEKRPPELEPTLDGFWVVRGYNRLPKKGGKFNELHGGATLEERLVPVVVFTREKENAMPTKLGKKSAEQIVDKMDFDDI